MRDLAKLEKLIQPILDAKKVILYEMGWNQEHHDQVLCIAIMQEDGSMNIDLCTEISQQISELLDEVDQGEQAYMLEVCSPGAERKLNTIQQMRDSIGKRVYAKLKNPKSGIDEVTGNLLAVDEQIIKIQYLIKTAKKEIEIEMDNLAIIRLAVSMK